MSSKSHKQELEKLMELYFDEYSTLTQLRSQLNEALKNGYFLISKSRYTMGLKALGQLQYPEYMKSTFLLQKPKNGYQIDNEENNHIVYIDNTNGSNNNNQNIVDNHDDGDVNSKNGSNGSNSGTNESNINSTGGSGGGSPSSALSPLHSSTTTRRRNKFSKDPEISVDPKTGYNTMGSIERLLNTTNIEQDYTTSEDDDGDDDDSDNSDTDDTNDSNNNNNTNNNNNNIDKSKSKLKSKRKKEIKSNPIFWFGYLTPPSLKQSQSFFKQAVTLSIEISNKLITMETIQRKYKELEKQHQ